MSISNFTTPGTGPLGRCTKRGCGDADVSATFLVAQLAATHDIDARYCRARRLGRIWLFSSNRPRSMKQPLGFCCSANRNNISSARPLLSPMPRLRWMMAKHFWSFCPRRIDRTRHCRRIQSRVRFLFCPPVLARQVAGVSRGRSACQQILRSGGGQCRRSLQHYP